MTLYAMHRSTSIAANAADERSALALGNGAPCMRTQAAKRQSFALFASFALVDPT